MDDDTDTKTSHDWFAASRRIFDHPLFKGDVYSRRDAWLWLIANAAWREHQVMTRSGPITLNRGQVLVGRDHLAQTWKWTVRKVRTFLGHLVGAGMLEIDQRNGQYVNVATISNYERFQTLRDEDRPAKRPTSGQRATNERPHSTKDTKDTKDTSRARDDVERRILEAALADFNHAADALGFEHCTTLSDSRGKTLAERLRDLGVGDIEAGGRRFREALSAIPHWPFLAGKEKPRDGYKPYRLGLDRLLATDSGLGDVLARLCDLHDTEGPAEAHQVQRLNSAEEFNAMWADGIDEERAAQRARFNGIDGGEHEPVH